MSSKKHIDDILRRWPYDPQTLNVRICRGSDGREVIQMRIEMGVLQLEMNGRPDGTQPQGAESYFDHLLAQQLLDGGDFVLTEDQCSEVDREFVQYYHRRICWLKLQRYDRAVQDADHTLAMMDFCRRFSPDEQWTMSHEQYRPFVLFHRTQAAALSELEKRGPEAAVHSINGGLDRMRTFFVTHEADEQFDEDELVARLVDLRESLRHEYGIGRTLQEQLADAVASEQYELAARLRDELARRDMP